MSEIKGLDNLNEKLDSLLDRESIERALGKCCALVEHSAKQKAPKGNGDLRRSIKSKVEGDTGIVFTALEYAPYRYVRSLNRAKSGKPKQLKYHTI